MAKMTLSVSMAINPPIECDGTGSHSSGKIRPQRFLAQRIEVRVTGDDAFGSSGHKPIVSVNYSGMKGQRSASYFASDSESLASIRKLMVERAETAFTYATTIQEPT